MKIYNVELEVSQKDIKSISTAYQDKESWRVRVTFGSNTSIDLDEETLLRALAVIETDKKRMSNET